MSITAGGTIQYYATTTKSWTIMVTDAGVPENITLTDIYFTIKRDKGDADPGVYQDTLVIVGGPAGEARLDLIPADLASVTAGPYYADIKYIKTVDTEVYELWEGWINIIKPVTDAIA